MLLASCVRLGIFDALHPTPATGSDVAARLGLNPDSVHRVLRAAATIGAVTMDGDGRVALTAGGALLRSDAPGSLATHLLYSASEEQLVAWQHLDAALADDINPYIAAHGRDVWADMAAEPQRAHRFDTMMSQLTASAVPPLVAAYPWPATGRVTDIGGGIGTLLAAILAARPGLAGVLVDQDSVLQRAATAFQIAGLDDRVTLHRGDLLTGLGELTGSDLYLLKEILHDWDDDTALRILRHLRAAVPPDARVVIIEMAQPANVPIPGTSMVDIQMMVVCDGGRQRSQEQLTAMLDAAGFAAQRTDVAASGHVLITAA
jgi:predicted O-methyltransferase YrrM